MESLINIGIILTYLMVGFAALTAIGFGIKKMMQNTNNTKKILYSICGLISICLVAYVLSSVFDYSPNYWSMDLVDKKVGVSLNPETKIETLNNKKNNGWIYLCNYKNNISNIKMDINLFYKFIKNKPKKYMWYPIDRRSNEFIPSFTKKIFKKIAKVYN